MHWQKSAPHRALPYEAPDPRKSGPRLNAYQYLEGYEDVHLELLSYIEKNYETCTLPEMGKAFGMHGNYLTALLKEKTGRSFVEHVQEQRLKKARMLLETTELPLSELIPLCGYNNMNFFYRKFREAEGCTPAQYRKEHRNTL